MLKSVLLMLLVTSNVFANGLILRKFAQTGRVDPSEAFTKECSVYKNGEAVILIVTENSSTTDTKEVSQRTVHQIKVLLSAARNGEITEDPYPCDVGTNTLHGFLGKETIELDVATNCRSHRVNQSPATPMLKSLATEICEF